MRKANTRRIFGAFINLSTELSIKNKGEFRMYRLFYNYPVSKDVLFVLIDPSKKVTKTKRVEEVEALYNEDELIGYNIFDVSKTVKLNADGIIFLPEKHL
ncbi:MAG TPA: hypothetical protein DCZ41_03685, partial [Firmicutes bacterium]|nr:hypothetical protein [Bacillota bacterium]